MQLRSLFWTAQLILVCFLFLVSEWKNPEQNSQNLKIWFKYLLVNSFLES